MKKLLIVFLIPCLVGVHSCKPKNAKTNQLLIFKLKNDIRIPKSASKIFGLDDEYFKIVDLYPSMNQSPLKDSEINSLLSKTRGLKISFLFKCNSPIIGVVNQKAKDLKCNITNLSNYFVIESKQEIKKEIIDKIIFLLQQLPFIEYAEEYYNQAESVQKSKTVQVTPKCPTNRILNLPTLENNNVKFIDVEHGWKLSMPAEYDVQYIRGSGRRNPVFGTNSTDITDITHGTGTLSVIKGRGIRNFSGLASNADTYLVSTTNCGTPPIAAAILNAVYFAIGDSGVLEKGNIILLEEQYWGGMPLEYSKLFYDLIQLGICFDTIIIEPAGNGYICLDSVPSIPGTASTKPKRSLRTSDSGALIVGATNFNPCSTSTTLTKNSVTNYGSIINTYAWGDSIWALAPVTSITPTGIQNFNNTSGASAIIAGLAVYIQSLYKSKYPTNYITPPQMKKLLYNNLAKTCEKTGRYTMPNLSHLNAELANIYTINTGGTGRTIISICR